MTTTPEATATEILMPRLSDSMEEGTILNWLVEPGQRVEAGEELVEIETDKANMAYAAEVAGVVSDLAEEGATLPVGAPIARIGAGPEATAEAIEPAADAIEPATAPPSAAPIPSTSPPPTPAAAAGPSAPATPLARRAAALHGVAIEALTTGSGPRGRIVKADVLRSAGIEAPAPPAAVPAPAGDRAPALAPALAPAPVATPSPTGAKGGSSELPLTRQQALIARRMAEAKATVPHFQVATEARMDAVIALRAGFKEVAAGGPIPSLNDFVVRAAALALREHPKANGSYRGDAFELHDRVNVGIAVAGEGALVVPTILDADRRSLGEIGRESRRLAERVRAATVTPPELAGGTFTVSNLGMYGMTAIVPVINPPQAAILGVGAVREVLRRGAGGEIEDAALMTLTLSCDHRILYGAEASLFLAAIRGLLESPLRIAL
jgi:pyruvate dehydrogenase E2 component (dihydrolipoamide acetyltransferase)